jgi:hypothetical protein
MYYGEIAPPRHGRYCIKLSRSQVLDAEPVLSWMCGDREVVNKGRMVNDARGERGDRL